MNAGAAFAEQFGDGLMPLRGIVAIGQWVVQAMAQPARAHAGRAGVEQRQQRWRGQTPQRFGNFQVAAGGRIEAKISALVFDD